MNVHAERRIAALLLAAVAVLAVWMVLANRSRRPFEAFALTAASFAGFEPRVEGWNIRATPIKPDPIEPNILVYSLAPRIAAPQAREGLDRPDWRAVAAAPGDRPISVRLVHGYNMCDCMRIKQYRVELITDHREAPLSTSSAPAPMRVQIWRLIAPGGDVSIWVTSMLRAGDLRDTAEDVRAMAFPRIGVPDDPNWLPRGITWRSLRHPIRNFRQLLRGKWNDSRRDLLTFLGLRQPAWASEDRLTLVTASGGATVRPEEETQVRDQVLHAHGLIHTQVREWWGRRNR